MDELFQFEDLTSTFSVADVVISMVLSFVLTAIVGWVYMRTHEGVSYTKSFVQTLVLMGMIVSVIMLVVGSNIARAFSLVGALSIIRFRNAIKETRDVGFVFFAMAIGMATGTRFYLLAIIATAVISMVVLLMTRFNWYERTSVSQMLKVQVTNDIPFETALDDVLTRNTDRAELVSVDSVRGGMLTEVVYAIALKPSTNRQAFLAEIKRLNENQKVTLLTGYGSSDL
jgi:uncharacterized membrane protein YhiD involved in acid resistance